MEQHFDENAQMALNKAVNFAVSKRYEFLTPEILIYAGINGQYEFAGTAGCLDLDQDTLDDMLLQRISDYEVVPDDVDYNLELSSQMSEVLAIADQRALSSEREQVSVVHLVDAIFELKDSWAKHILTEWIDCPKEEFMAVLIENYEGVTDETDVEDDKEVTDPSLDEPTFDEPIPSNGKKDEWKNYVTCINEHLKDHNPLIGREAELERTIQVLCRCDKNNPLHVGEPGVGKTSLVYGLAQRIADGKVPDRLRGALIFSLDLGGVLAGTQYRGDFEKRIKKILEGVRRVGNAIIYIDEIHNLIGAGQTGEGAMDASNMLKPYLEGGEIRFIGSTTYQEYNRYFAKSKGIVRRFQQIDVLEPSVDDAVKILEGLQAKYESFHHVKYADGVLRYAVEMSAKYINERFLPDKAIDLIDEAGAYLELHPVEGVEQIVNKELVSDVLSKICKVDSLAIHEDDNANLEDLSDRISSKIYGQPDAVRQVVEAVQMGKAGLLDDDKPIASLLFVGPTGVGKTEVTKVLASELGIPLIRFDMSEYTEKHTVAKLIGSPAGYVGYEDGGLLTDTIRKSPNCVLLLDEIEKAHSDIYNILLQVMDYAKLTDNKGQKADFRNVILVMTSNAGAQYASQASVGFASSVTTGQAMLAQVKKTFKPEFLNRLSGTVIFNDMDMTMASMILDKKLGQLSGRLKTKKVTMNVDAEAHSLLLQWGYTRQYGAREMDRVIRQKLSPLLMHEILFGSLKNGGTVEVSAIDGQLALKK